jgi:hypothetical protein
VTFFEIILAATLAVRCLPMLRPIGYRVEGFKFANLCEFDPQVLVILPTRIVLIGKIASQEFTILLGGKITPQKLPQQGILL